MASTYTFNTQPGRTVDRHLMLLCLNTAGSADAPVWSPIGKRVEESSIEFDWSTETKQDILGKTYVTGKKAVRTQTFDPCELDAEDAAQLKIWNLAIAEDDINALLALDLLLVHMYVNADDSGGFMAERFDSSSVLPTALGGEGGGQLGMPIDVTFGGTRTVGSAKITNGSVTFTPAA